MLGYVALLEAFTEVSTQATPFIFPFSMPTTPPRMTLLLTAVLPVGGAMAKDAEQSVIWQFSMVPVSVRVPARMPAWILPEYRLES